MKSNVLGTGVIRRLLMERTSILTLPSARGGRRASPHDCRVALDSGMSGNGEAARVHEAGASLERIGRLRAHGSLSGFSI